MKRTSIFSSLIFVVLFLLPFVGASAHPASGIVVDRSGQLYFSDLETVWKLDARGRLSVFRPGVSGRHVHELTIDEAGNIYGADISYVPASVKWIQAVWRMTPEGQQTFLVNPTDQPPRAASIWRDREGNSFFVEQDNHRKRETLLLRRTPAGEVSIVAGGPFGFADGKGTEARFGSIGGMTLAPDGSLYVTDGNAVRRVEMNGTVRTLAKNLNADMPDISTKESAHHVTLMGLAVGTGGSVFAADHENRRVLQINADGKAATFLRADSPWTPTGVATDDDGSVYVLEISFTPPGTYKGPRVRKVTPDCKATIVATVGEPGARSERQTSRTQEEPSQPGVEEASAPAPSHPARLMRLITPALIICLGLVAAGVFIRRRRQTTSQTGD